MRREDDDDEPDASGAASASSAAAAASVTACDVKFLKGDRVKVVKGDLKNLTGRVITSSSTSVLPSASNRSTLQESGLRTCVAFFVCMCR